MKSSEQSTPSACASPLRPPDETIWRNIYVVLVIVAISIGGTLRFQHLDADYSHYDEPIPLALLERIFVQHDWDINWKKTDLEPFFRIPQYNFSAYIYCVAIGEKTARWLGADSAKSSTLMRLRTYSAAMGSITLFLVAISGYKLGRWPAATAATWLVALNPLLIQDAHYARPEAFVTLLVTGALALLMTFRSEAPPPTWALAVSAFLIGLAGACKISLLPLLALPLIAGWTTLSRTWLLFLVGSLGAFGWILGAPALIYNPVDFISGVQTLNKQYASAFPVHSRIDGASGMGMTASYFIATLGIGTFLLCCLGTRYLVREKRHADLAFLLVPVLSLLVIFSTKAVFFERNYSHALPGFLMLAAAGILSMTGPASRIIAGCALVSALYTPAAISWTFVEYELSGQARSDLAALRNNLIKTLPGIPGTGTVLVFKSNVDYVLEMSQKNPKGILLEIWGANDEWTARNLTELKSRLNLIKIGTWNGPFGNLPTCTLQTYHQHTVSFFLAKSAETPPL